MLFTIHALDKPGALPIRLDHYEAHKTFLARAEEHGVRIIMSGPLVEDDGETMKGSFFLIEAPDRATIEAFHHADPFYKAGVWQTANIIAFIRRVG